MRSTVDLMVLAENLGVTLTHHVEGPKGLYSPSRGMVSTRRGLSIAQWKSTLAHELAHVTYEDEGCTDPVIGARVETRADRWAADYLLSPVEVVHALEWSQGRVPEAAYELEVTPHLLHIWLDRHPVTTWGH